MTRAQGYGRRDTITVDLSDGSNGDNWMRLVGFYVVAAIHPDIELKLIVPRQFAKVAPCVFGDRLQFVQDSGGPVLRYSGRRGLRHLLPGALKGQRYLVPYHRIVVKDWNRWTAKDRINVFLHTAADRLNILQLPPWPALHEYQGLLEVQCLARLRNTSADAFYAQLEVGYPALVERMNGDIPHSFDFKPPSDLGNTTIVFPTGRGRQFIPLWWAQQYMPDATYVYFHKDHDAIRFADAGLRTILFQEPGDIVHLARSARWTVSTDSFPSHLVQFTTSRASILITGSPRKRIVAPTFKGQIIDATAPCHPCPHLEKGAFPLCKAGHAECLNWNDAAYSAAVVASIGQH